LSRQQEARAARREIESAVFDTNRTPRWSLGASRWLDALIVIEESAR
jgi:hypothetical protein